MKNKCLKKENTVSNNSECRFEKSDQAIFEKGVNEFFEELMDKVEDEKISLKEAIAFFPEKTQK